MFDVNLDLSRLEYQIEAFEQEPIEEGLIMFYGNSGFTRWKPRYGHRPLEDDIRMTDGSKAVINHGFGSSTTEDQLYFYPRAVRPWKPRALVLLSYANNLMFGYSPAEAMMLLQRICAYARKELPGIQLYLCDVRPLAKNVDNASAQCLLKIYNDMLADYCAKYDDCILVEHKKWPGFFEEGHTGDYTKVPAHIFVEDMVHYNQAGYDIYGEFFREVLKDLLQA